MNHPNAFHWAPVDSWPPDIPVESAQYRLHSGLEVALTSARQHPSYGDCLEFKREYYQNSSMLDCVTQCSQSTAHLYEQF